MNFEVRRVLIRTMCMLWIPGYSLKAPGHPVRFLVDVLTIMFHDIDMDGTSAERTLEESDF